MNFRTRDEVRAEIARLKEMEPQLPIMTRIAPGTLVSTRHTIAVQVRVLDEQLGVDAVYLNWKAPALEFALAACEWRMGGQNPPSEFWRRSKR